MAIVGIIFINTVASNLIYSDLQSQKVKAMYDEANLIASKIPNKLVSDDNDNNEFQSTLNSFEQYESTYVWVLDTTGTIGYSSNPNYLGLSFPEFDVSYFDGKYFTKGNFYGYFKESTISVMCPITDAFNTFGFILIHCPASVIETSANGIISVIYLIFAALFTISLILLLIFAVAVYVPIKRITNASKEFANGNFEYDDLDKLKKNNEIGELAASLSFMSKEFMQLEEDQKKFIANISHDFRSPLTSIKGYAEAMIDDTIPVEFHTKYLNIILTESERLNKLTRNLLTLNTWNSKGNHLDLINFDLNKVIKDTIATFEGLCNKKHLFIDLIFESPSYNVYADMGKIQQVIYNLIDNAIKFSPNDSKLTIHVSDKYEKVFVSIKDRGIGIPKESLSKIWERFYKSDLSRGKDKTGTGLGLSIVKEIITNHNENINVISTEGIGTEFIFTLQKAKN